MAVSQESIRETGVLPVLLIPAELPEMNIYTYICVTE